MVVVVFGVVMFVVGLSKLFEFILSIMDVIFFGCIGVGGVINYRGILVVVNFVNYVMIVVCGVFVVY